MNGDKEIALHQYIQDQMGKPFEFGVNDCALFSAKAIDVIAGTSFYEDLKGKWSSKKEALIYEKEHEIAEYLKGHFSQVENDHAQTGDIVLIDSEGRPSTAICLGLKIAFLMEDGIHIQSINTLPIMEVYRV